MPRGKSKSSAGGSGKTPAAELNKQIKKLGLAQAQVAKDVGLSAMTLKKILDGKANVDVERALIFGKYFGNGADFWIDLQKKAGLAKAKKDAKLQKQLKGLKKAKPVKAEKKVVAKKGAKKTKASAKKTKAGAKRGPKAKTAKSAKPAGKKPAAKKSATKKATVRKTTTPSSSPSSSSSSTPSSSSNSTTFSF